jgi:DNA-binding transcriptional LysR family regulator
MHKTHMTDLSRIDLNLLVVMQRLLRHRNVTAAAKELGLSQPAVSRSLNRLRSALNDELFVRAAGGMVATPLALQIEPLVEQALEAARRCFEKGREFDLATVQRSFNIASADYGQAVFLPKLLQFFSARAPGLRINMVPVQEPFSSRLQQGSVDLMLSPVLPMDAGIVWKQLFHDNFAFALRKGHPELKSKVLSIERFVQIPQIAIAPQGASGNPMDEQLSSMRRQRRVVAQVSSFFVAGFMVATSQLGAILPLRILKELTPRLHLEPRQLPFATKGFSLAQAWHERFRNDPLHRLVRQTLAELS